MITNDTIVQFGSGDIIINIGKRDGEDKPKAVIFRNSRKSFKIGEKGEMKEYATKDARVVLYFDNVESLNVVINILNELKKLMEDEKDEKK